MTAATVGANGQVAIPVEVLAGLGLREGDSIEFVLLNDWECLVVPRTGSVEQLRGMFGRAERRVSTAEMNEAVGREASDDQRASRPGR